jgi:hypothetical protein
MAGLILLENTSQLNLLQGMDQVGLFDSNWDEVVITVQKDCFIHASAMAILAVWGLAKRGEGKKIKFIGDPNVLSYLSRMDIFKHVGFPYNETFSRHAEIGRFLPVKLVRDIDDVPKASNAVCELVLHQFENSRDFLPAMEWCLYEVIDNIQLHSESPTPGVVCAQYYPKKHRLDIAIVDQGRGIKSSLEERLELWSHGDAITRALERGMTRNSDIGQGNGLAGTHEIIKKNMGGLDIWTGNALYQVKQGEDKGFKELPMFLGTGVFLRLDTQNPVDLKETFVCEPVDWSYIDFISGDIEEKGGIIVKDECAHTGGREPAKGLRRKIEAILPETEGSLTIDFYGITSAASSFFDELLGRLAYSMGEEKFRAYIKIKNLPDDLRAMAEVVVRQRCHGDVDNDNNTEPLD